MFMRRLGWGVVRVGVCLTLGLASLTACASSSSAASDGGGSTCTGVDGTYDLTTTTCPTHFDKTVTVTVSGRITISGPSLTIYANYVAETGAFTAGSITGTAKDCKLTIDDGSCHAEYQRR